MRNSSNVGVASTGFCFIVQCVAGSGVRHLAWVTGGGSCERSTLGWHLYDEHSGMLRAMPLLWVLCVLAIATATTALPGFGWR